jgi:nucleotide-binding universal stress UspA family protein
MNPMSQRTAPIVVGLDLGEASLAALRWAAEEAAAHGAPLTAVYVTDPRSRGFAPYAAAGGSEPAPLDGAALVEQAIARSGVPRVRRVFEVGVPSEVLVNCAIGARMLVLGHADHHRRHDGAVPRRGPVLGSVARACMEWATCPVVVVPIPARSPARAAAEPEPRRVPVLEGSPVRGGRAIYPRRPHVPLAYGGTVPSREKESH